MDDTLLVDGLVQLSFAVQQALGRVATRHDLSVVQLRLFGILRDRRPSMAQIADHLGLDRSSVTGLVDRAEARGLVVRRSDPNDGRGVQVRLTARGRRLCDTGTREVGAEIAELATSLTATEAAASTRIAAKLARVSG